MIMVTQICRVHGVIVFFNQLNVLKKQALWDNKSILGYAKRSLKENDGYSSLHRIVRRMKDSSNAISDISFEFIEFGVYSRHKSVKELNWVVKV